MATDPKPAKEDPLHKRCNQFINKACKSNPYIVSLFNAMESNGCKIPKDFIKCQPCIESATAAHFDTKNGITVCENNLGLENHVNSAVIHELIHAYDMCRAKLNPKNCVHVACTEIRAATLSGDCYWSREFIRGYGFKLSNQFQNCVRRRAELSLSMSPTCADVSKDAVRIAWDSCFNDWDPFDAIP